MADAPAPADTDITTTSTDDEFSAAFAEFSGGSEDTLPAGDAGGQDTQAAGDGETAAQAADTTTTSAPANEAGATDQPAPSAGTTTTTPPAGAATTTTTQDTWADAKPEHRSAHEALQREAAGQREQALRRTRENERLKARLTELETQVATGLPAKPSTTRTTPPTGTGTTAAAQALLDKPAFKKLADEYPEVAEPLREIMSDLTAEVDQLRASTATMSRELGGMSHERREQFLSDQETQVRETHPDYDAITNSQSFKDWCANAPAYVAAGIKRNGETIIDGEEVAHILSVFKRDTGFQPTAPQGNGSQPAARPQTTTNPPAQGNRNQLPARRQRQLDAATSVPSRGVNQQPSGPPEEFDAAFKYFAERKGRQHA